MAPHPRYPCGRALRGLGVKQHRRRVSLHSDPGQQLAEQWLILGAGPAPQAQGLLEALPAAVYATDACGKITFFNSAAAALWGHRPASGAMWCGSWRLYWPDGRALPHEQCPMAIALRENRPVRGMEAVIERPDGSRVPMLPFPTPLRDAEGKLIGAINMLVDITERKRAEDRMMMLVREVDHRANNLLAVVQAMIRLSEAATPEELKEVLAGRIKALGNAHGLLANGRRDGADLESLVGAELAPYCQGTRQRARISGPTLRLNPAAAQTMALVIHELATNAAKYGALSMIEGVVRIRWRQPTERDLIFIWKERGGPIVSAPGRCGVGIALVEQAVKRQLQGNTQISWEEGGMVCKISAALERLAALRAPADGVSLPRRAPA